MRSGVAAAAALAFLLAAPSAVRAQPRSATSERVIEEIQRDLPQIALPAAADITHGPRSVPSGAVIDGPVATQGGNLEVWGTVQGDAVAIDGSVIVHEGGRVAGDVLAVQGETRIAGTVTGAVMRLEGNLAAAPAIAAPANPVASVWRTMGITVAALGILLVLGIGVLIFSGPTLDTVIDVTQGQLSRAFLTGVLAELALLPGLLLVCVALALTILGLLLIPFAIVAYALAAAGAMTLGFLAVAVVIGGAIARRRNSRPLTARATALRAMMIGVFTIFALWLVAAAVAWAPLAAGIVRLVALAATWVAVTAGFGAVILSRVAPRRAAAPLSPVVPLDEISWQTPTPVSGVAAARRPTPVVSGKGR